MSENLTHSESMLPNLPAAEYFSAPLYAAATKKFWEDDTVLTLEEAVTKVAAAMTPQELLAATKVLDDLASKLAAHSDDGYAPNSLYWMVIDDSSYTIDETGVIYGILGSATAVKATLTDNDTVGMICDELVDYELDAAYERAGLPETHSLEVLVYDEEHRRRVQRDASNGSAAETAQPTKLYLL